MNGGVPSWVDFFLLLEGWARDFDLFLSSFLCQLCGRPWTGTASRDPPRELRRMETAAAPGIRTNSKSFPTVLRTGLLTEGFSPVDSDI